MYEWFGFQHAIVNSSNLLANAAGYHVFRRTQRVTMSFAERSGLPCLSQTEPLEQS